MEFDLNQIHITKVLVKTNAPTTINKIKITINKDVNLTKKIQFLVIKLN